MKFICESQLIFKVRVGGIEKVVRFSEPNSNNSTTVFMTQDKALIMAIRGHKFYKMGKIREVKQPGEVIDHIGAQVAKTLFPPKSAPITVPAKDIPALVKQPEPPAKVMNFESFSQLKNYLKKTYGQEAANLKTAPQVAKFAKEKGIAYTYNKK